MSLESRLYRKLNAQREKTPINLSTEVRQEEKTQRSLTKSDEEIKKVFVELKQTFNAFQSQKAELMINIRALKSKKTKDAKNKKSINLSVHGEASTSKLTQQSEQLKIHIKKIGDCINHLEQEYNDVIADNRPEAKNRTQQIHKSINAHYQWPADSSVKEEFLKLLRRVLIHAKQSPVLAITDFFKDNKRKGASPSSDSEPLVESMAELDLNEGYPESDDSGYDTDKTVEYYSC